MALHVGVAPRRAGMAEQGKAEAQAADVTAAPGDTASSRLSLNREKRARAREKERERERERDACEI